MLILSLKDQQLAAVALHEGDFVIPSVLKPMFIKRKVSGKKIRL